MQLVQQQQLLLEAAKLVKEMQMPSNSSHYSREGKNEMCTIYLRKYDTSISVMGSNVVLGRIVHFRNHIILQYILHTHFLWYITLYYVVLFVL